MHPDGPPGIWAPAPAEVVAEIRGTASPQAKSHWELQQTEPEMPDWGWLVGGSGYNPESGRPYMYMHNRGCDSTNRTCYCAHCVAPIIGRACECSRHKNQTQPEGETA